jgi:HAD superfamily hydrolase (TIGR01509 family)
MHPRALLLDFDGVIADTENHHVAAWQRTFEAMGWTVDDAACARAMEVDDRVFLAEVFAGRRIEGGDVDGWVRRKQELTLALLRDAPRVYPGVAALVGRLRDEVSLAVVTTTWRGNVETVLAASGLSDAFRLIVGKEDVAAPKPDPECYRLAVSRLGLRPQEAVALEDSPSGLAAARGAGVRAVAVGHRKAKGAWVGSATFLPDLTDTAAVCDALGLA